MSHFMTALILKGINFSTFSEVRDRDNFILGLR